MPGCKTQSASLFMCLWVVSGRTTGVCYKGFHWFELLANHSKNSGFKETNVWFFSHIYHFRTSIPGTTPFFDLIIGLIMTTRDKMFLLFFSLDLGVLWCTNMITPADAMQPLQTCVKYPAHPHSYSLTTWWIVMMNSCRITFTHKTWKCFVCY